MIPPSQQLVEKFKVEARFVASDISSETVRGGMDLITAGKFRPVVSKTHKLEEAALAQDFLAVGRLILTQQETEILKTGRWED